MVQIVTNFRNPLLSTRPMAPVETTRVCHHEGCSEPAPHVDGRYMAGPRLVRVWACGGHYGGDPMRSVPVPDLVRDMAELMDAQHEKVRRYYTHDVAPEKSESVKFLASTGWGEPIGFNRADSFRWGENTGDVLEPKPLPIPARTAMILRVKAREFVRTNKKG